MSDTHEGTQHEAGEWREHDAPFDDAEGDDQPEPTPPRLAPQPPGVPRRGKRTVAESAPTQTFTPEQRLLILDMLAAGLRNAKSVSVTGSTRMIQAARWVAACTAHVGWAPEYFTDHLEEIAADGAHDALDGNPLLSGVVELVEQAGEFVGTMTELRDAIVGLRGHQGKLPLANKMSGELGRNVQALRKLGVIFEKLPRTGKGRRIRLLKGNPAPESTVTAVTDAQPDWLDWAEIAG
ncbi:MAG: hypothetical protein H6841_06200 [Planctomycetes bacterium]|nr:hypothetical protein [Planctomycetota bacterium]